MLLAAIGAEIGSLFIIALALAILCAPWAFGLGVAWLVADWAYALSGSPVPGWILGVILFAFFCRYVWGSRLQRASRRAAEALIAEKS
jgi:4-hydroxybenzoate polyprenyltransferase